MATAGRPFGTLSLYAMELAEQRIRDANCIAPGYIKVDSGTSPPISDFETALIKNTPWGRLGTPADIAPVPRTSARWWTKVHVSSRGRVVDGSPTGSRRARRRPVLAPPALQNRSLPAS